MRNTIKDIIDNRVDKPGDPGLKVIEMIVPQDKKLAGIISHTMLTNRGRGSDVIDPYRIAQALLRNQVRQSMIRPEDSEDDIEVEVSG